VKYNDDNRKHAENEVPKNAVKVKIGTMIDDDKEDDRWCFLSIKRTMYSLFSFEDNLKIYPYRII
jgi:hypothetical protein